MISFENVGGLNIHLSTQTQRLAAMNDPSQILGDHNAQMNRLNNLALPESTQLTTAQVEYIVLLCSLACVRERASCHS